MAPIITLVALFCWILGCIYYVISIIGVGSTLLARGPVEPVQMFIFPTANGMVLILAAAWIVRSLPTWLKWVAAGTSWHISPVVAVGAEIASQAVDGAAKIAGSLGKTAISNGIQLAAGTSLDPNKIIQDVRKILADHGITDPLEEITVKAGGVLHRLTAPQIKSTPAAPPTPQAIQAVVTAGDK